MTDKTMCASCAEVAAGICEDVYLPGDWSDGVMIAQKCAGAIRAAATDRVSVPKEPTNEMVEAGELPLRD
jgi:hypothetical protein